MNEVIGSRIEMIEIECRQKQIKTYDAVPLFTDQPCPNKNKNKRNCNLLCLPQSGKRLRSNQNV